MVLRAASLIEDPASIAASAIKVRDQRISVAIVRLVWFHGIPR
jgi:hypothetical protein